MTMPITQFPVMNPPVQNPIPGNHLHTPRSIFEHMMAQQNIPHEPGSWAQIPQVPPMYMPWSVPSPQQPHLMRFTGEKPPVCGSTLHQKRKMDVPEIPRPTKQFISEDKMAAHFRDMHISTTHSPTPCSSSTPNYSILSQPSTSSEVDINVDSASSLENGKSMHPKLVISEELKRFRTEPILPASLLSKLERPSMALILWEPPSKHLRIFNTQREPQAQTSTSAASNANTNNNNRRGNTNNVNNNDNNNDNIVNNNNYISMNNNNNNNQMPDLNRVAAIESNDVEFEPMDV